MSILFGFWFAFVACSICGTFVFFKLRKWRTIDRFSIASFPIVLLLIFSFLFNQFLIIFSTIEWNNKGTWSPIRLLPTFALTHHYPLYANSTNEPIIGMIYGPVMALAYLPVSIAQSPTIAVILGSFITAAFYFVPVVLLSFRNRLCHLRRGLPAAIAIALFSIFTVFSPVLRYVAFSIHADSPALGLSAAACAVLCYRQRPENRNIFLLSAILAVLAVWTKQVAVPVVIAIPLYLLLAEGFQCFKRYVFYLLSSGLLISALFLALFNPQDLFFNMFVIPSHHPWRGSNNVSILLSSSLELLRYCSIPLAIIIAAILREASLFVKMRENLKAQLQKPWILFFILGFLSIPTSLLGRVKIGGDVNTLSYALYFLAIAAVLIIIEFLSAIRWTQFASTGKFLRPIFAIGYSAFFLVQLFALPPQLSALADNFNLGLQNLYNYPSEIAYKYAKNHPGEAYFPWQTLSSIMAEGKMYHFEYGLFDRELAGFPVSDRHFQAGIPANIQLIAFYSRNDGYTLDRLSEFSRQIELDELPGWTIYVREN